MPLNDLNQNNEITNINNNNGNELSRRDLSARIDDPNELENDTLIVTNKTSASQNLL